MLPAAGVIITRSSRIFAVTYCMGCRDLEERGGSSESVHFKSPFLPFCGVTKCANGGKGWTCSFCGRITTATLLSPTMALGTTVLLLDLAPPLLSILFIPLLLLLLRPTEKEGGRKRSFNLDFSGTGSGVVEGWWWCSLLLVHTYRGKLCYIEGMDRFLRDFEFRNQRFM